MDFYVLDAVRTHFVGVLESANSLALWGFMFVFMNFVYSLLSFCLYFFLYCIVAFSGR